MMPTPQEVWKDPDFLGLHPVEKAKVMRAIDPEFAGLPSVEQHRVVFQLTNRSAVPQDVQPGPEGEPVGRLDARDPFSYSPAETEAMRRKFVADEMSFGGDNSLAGSSRDVMGIGGTAQMRDQTRAAAIEAGKKLVRPVLKTVGAVGGTVAAGGNPAGTVAGYAIGDEVANLVTGELPSSVPTAPAESVADFATPRTFPSLISCSFSGASFAILFTCSTILVEAPTSSAACFEVLAGVIASRISALTFSIPLPCSFPACLCRSFASSASLGAMS